MSDTASTSTANTGIRPVEKNGVTLIPVLVEAKRGAYKGQSYPTIRIDEKESDEGKLLEQLVSVVKFRGLKRAAKIFNAYETAEGQTALEMAADYLENKTVDPESGKEVITKQIQKVDFDEYWNVYLSDTLRGGETIADLEAERDALQKEFMPLFTEFMSTKDPIKGARLMELQAEMQQTEETINGRRRAPRKSKAA